MTASHLDWPFFTDAHRALRTRAAAWAGSEVGQYRAMTDIDAAARGLVRSLGEAGLLEIAAPAGAPDVRSLCIVREALACEWSLADFAFAMQGLGSGPIALFGSEALKREYLSRVRSGAAIAAFAITERDAGSDLGAIAATATRDGDAFVLGGEKCWISNGGIADFYVVFARTGEGPGTKGISAFVVDAGTPGLDASERTTVISPHPMATVRLSGCRVAADRMVGDAGRGIAVALATLDGFRATVGAAATGLARRALAESSTHAASRRQFGSPLSEFQMVQAKLAEMATAIDASALLVYRAAWEKDTHGGRVSAEAAMAKAFATEAAQRVIDDAVQIHGALGVERGSVVEELYRDIRPLRIYEGATDIQKLIIARGVMESNKDGRPR